MPSSGATRKSAGRRARTILLVDPSPDRLSSLEQTLGEEHNLTCATTAEEAIQRIQTTGIELVVASAEVCSSRLLEVVASNGLSRACIFLAAPNQSETLVRAYAAQHTFRVLSSDRSAQTLRAFVHSALYPREAARHSIPGVVAKLTLGDGSTTSCPLLDLSNRGLAVRLDSPRGVLLPGTAIPQVALYRDTEQLLDGVAGTVRYIEVIAPGEETSRKRKSSRSRCGSSRCSKRGYRAGRARCALRTRERSSAQDTAPRWSTTLRRSR